VGYREPRNDAGNWTGFSAQFEWDGGRWLFRRGGRARPVEVTREEMIRSVEHFENGTLALVALLLSVLVFGWVFETVPEAIGIAAHRSRPVFIGLGAGVLFLTGHYGLGRLLTRSFNGRAPQGPARTRLEVRRSVANAKSWGGLLALPAYFVFLAGLHWFLDGDVDWIWVCFAVVATVISAFDAWLKWQARSLKRPH
jgi:hypothetical protein